VRLRFLESNGVALLQDFVDGDEGFEGLHFVREDWLPRASDQLWQLSEEIKPTYTFMACQKDPEFLWSHVYTMAARTCFPVSA
jgi:hypothetical protein